MTCSVVSSKLTLTIHSSAETRDILSGIAITTTGETIILVVQAPIPAFNCSFGVILHLNPRPLSLGKSSQPQIKSCPKSTLSRLSTLLLPPMAKVVPILNPQPNALPPALNQRAQRSAHSF